MTSAVRLIISLVLAAALVASVFSQVRVRALEHVNAASRFRPHLEQQRVDSDNLVIFGTSMR